MLKQNFELVTQKNNNVEDLWNFDYKDLTTVSKEDKLLIIVIWRCISCRLNFDMLPVKAVTAQDWIRGLWVNYGYLVRYRSCSSCLTHRSSQWRPIKSTVNMAFKKTTSTSQAAWTNFTRGISTNSKKDLGEILLLKTPDHACFLSSFTSTAWFPLTEFAGCCPSSYIFLIHTVWNTS